MLIRVASGFPCEVRNLLLGPWGRMAAFRRGGVEAPTGLRVKGLLRYRGVDQGLEGWMWVGRGQDYQGQDDPIISTGDAEIRSDKGWKYKKSS